jgi:2-keto-3-deoxy-L-rhamnonate aldolase RhmA
VLSASDADYYETTNSEVLVAIQIETREVVDNLDDILLVEGKRGGR